MRTRAAVIASTSNSAANSSTSTTSALRKRKAPPIADQPAKKAKSTPPAAGPSDLPIVLLSSQTVWDGYLDSNSTSSQGVWLKIAKKGNPTPTVKYDEAIDVALCHGWIDGQRKSFDEGYFLQRFTPRRKKSMWSKRNVEKVGMLLEQGRMRERGLEEVEAAKQDGRWEKAYSKETVMVEPPDFAAAIEKNAPARKEWEKLGRTQKYTFLWALENTKRAETRKRKIDEYIASLVSEDP